MFFMYIATALFGFLVCVGTAVSAVRHRKDSKKHTEKWEQFVKEEKEEKDKKDRQEIVASLLKQQLEHCFDEMKVVEDKHGFDIELSEEIDEYEAAVDKFNKEYGMDTKELLEESPKQFVSIWDKENHDKFMAGEYAVGDCFVLEDGDGAHDTYIISKIAGEILYLNTYSKYLPGIQKDSISSAALSRAVAEITGFGYIYYLGKFDE